MTHSYLPPFAVIAPICALERTCPIWETFFRPSPWRSKLPMKSNGSRTIPDTVRNAGATSAPSVVPSQPQTRVLPSAR
jgi:hypothetical protein